jgi:hypothetical protein
MKQTTPPNLQHAGLLAWLEQAVTNYSQLIINGLFLALFMTYLYLGPKNKTEENKERAKPVHKCKDPNC